MKKIYEIIQNNSGGNFIFSKEEGLGYYNFFIVNNKKELDIILDRLDIYFEGVRDGIDCSCCGDRWHLPVEISIEKFINSCKYLEINSYDENSFNTYHDINNFYLDINEVIKKHSELFI